MFQARQRMGYCPQFDAIIENMTGTETLEMYARIRGVPENKIDVIVQELMEALQLTVYKDRQVGTYRYPTSAIRTRFMFHKLPGLLRENL